ncbi:MAG: hypothetical protein WCS91_02600, partial [Bacilli bacterium]
NVTVSATFVVDPDYKEATVTYSVDAGSKSSFSSISFNVKDGNTTLKTIKWTSSTTDTTFTMPAGKKLAITVYANSFVGVQIDVTVDGVTTTKSADCDYTGAYYVSDTIASVDKDMTISIKKIATVGEDPDGGYGW